MYLFRDEQHDAFKQLVPIQGRDPHIQKETIEDRGGDVGQEAQNQDGQADQNVGKDGRQSGLPHSYNTTRKLCIWISISSTFFTYRYIILSIGITVQKNQKFSATFKTTWPKMEYQCNELPHNNPASSIPYKYSFQHYTYLYLHLVYVTLVHSLLHISQGSDVEGGVGESCMDPGERQQAEDSVDDPAHQQVPVVRRPLL